MKSYLLLYSCNICSWCSVPCSGLVNLWGDMGGYWLNWVLSHLFPNCFPAFQVSTIPLPILTVLLVLSVTDVTFWVIVYLLGVGHCFAWHVTHPFVDAAGWYLHMFYSIHFNHGHFPITCQQVSLTKITEKTFMTCSCCHSICWESVIALHGRICVYGCGFCTMSFIRDIIVKRHVFLICFWAFILFLQIFALLHIILLCHT